MVEGKKRKLVIKDTHLEDAGEITCATNRDSSSCSFQVKCKIYLKGLFTLFQNYLKSEILGLQRFQIKRWFLRVKVLDYNNFHLRQTKHYSDCKHNFKRTSIYRKASCQIYKDNLAPVSDQ